MNATRRNLGVAMRLALPVGVATLVFPGRADAHLVTTGLGPVYDGIGHLLLSPEDLLPAATVALLAGLNGSLAGRRALFLLPMAWLAGGIAGYTIGGSVLPAAATAVSLLALGLLTAADRRLPVMTVAAIAGGAGLLHGWLNGAALVDAGSSPLGLAGIVSAVFVLAALTAALVVSLHAAWTRVAVRVAGSWLAAIGLLMLGWAIRGAA